MFPSRTRVVPLDTYKGVVDDEGVEAQEAPGLSGEFLGFTGGGDADENTLI